MTFDGDYVTEGRDFPTIESAWERASDMGSRWFFYPFCFVTTASGATIKAAPEGMSQFEGRRVRTVANIFKQLAAFPEMQEVDADEFAVALQGMTL